VRPDAFVSTVPIAVLLVLMVAPAAVAAGFVELEGLLEVEVPQAVSATTAAATHPATHQRFSISLSPFTIVIWTVYTGFTYQVRDEFSRLQVAIRWQSHASDSGYR
jgi:hypothetical protein